MENKNPKEAANIHITQKLENSKAKNQQRTEKCPRARFCLVLNAHEISLIKRSPVIMC